MFLSKNVRHLQRLWRDGRVVDGAALEMRYTGDRIGGSNPFLSALNPDNQGIMIFAHDFAHVSQQIRVFFMIIFRIVYVGFDVETWRWKRRMGV